MKQPYENVYIGNFIFAMGFYAAQTKDKLSNKAVQLVQQTPDESFLNDLFFNWEGKNFIFEFKRNFEKIKIELDKHAKKRLNEALNCAGYERELSFSNRGHFLGYGSENGLNFIHYSKLHFSKIKYFPLDDFIGYMMDDDCDIGLSFSDFSEYLQFIGDATESNNEGCGGFVFNISKDGNLNMVPFDNIELLSQSIDNKPESHRPEATPNNSNTFKP